MKLLQFGFPMIALPQNIKSKKVAFCKSQPTAFNFKPLNDLFLSTFKYYEVLPLVTPHATFAPSHH